MKVVLHRIRVDDHACHRLKLHGQDAQLALDIPAELLENFILFGQDLNPQEAVELREEWKCGSNLHPLRF